MTEQSRTDEERRFASQLRSELDAAVRPFDPDVIVRRAAEQPSRPVLRLVRIGATIAAAVVITVAATQLPSLAPSMGSGPDPTETPNSSTRGPIPDSAWQDDGTIDMSQVPDFIPATDGDGTAGWIASEAVLPAGGNRSLEVIPVYADDLQTLVGHMYPRVGFVPLGTDPPTPPPVEDLTVLVRNDSDRVAVLEITEAPDEVDRRARIIAPVISLEPGKERRVKFDAPPGRWSLRLRDGDGGFFFSDDIERWSRGLATGSLVQFNFVITPERVLEVVTS